MMKIFTRIHVLPGVLLMLGCLLLSSCGDRQAAEQTDQLPDIFPDYIGVTIPSNIAPLDFEIKGATHIQATLTNAKGEILKAHGDQFVDIPVDDWHSLLATEGEVKVEVSAWTEEHPDGVTYKPFSINVVKEEIDPWVAYRLIPPGYEGWNRMGIYQRNLTNFDQLPIVENSQSNGGCVNCHCFANYSPDNFMFHARGAGGGTVIQHDGQLEKVDIKSMEPYKHGSYPNWHPHGKYIAYTSNDTHQSFFGFSQDKIEIYDLWSDLIIYDIEHHKVLADERFTDTLSLELFPAFSPDGKWLYFSTAHPVKVPQGYADQHYSIVRVAFNEKDGTLGQEVDTVYNAHQLGGSVMLPRFSPDGRYMLFTRADCGAFNLNHKETDLAMMDLTDRQMVDVSILNTPCSDSYHSWSSNGQWIVYSTKGIDTRFTRLQISHWNGKQFTKPFLLPQRDPEQNTQLIFAYNIPEFIKAPVQIARERMSELFKTE